MAERKNRLVELVSLARSIIFGKSPVLEYPSPPTDPPIYLDPERLAQLSQEPDKQTWA